MRDQHNEPLNDDLTREIEQALAVEPSPEFQARVRQRVAEAVPLAPRGWWSAVAIPAAALAVIVIGALVGWQLMQPGERGDAVPAVANDQREMPPVATGVRGSVTRDDAASTAPTPVVGNVVRDSRGERLRVATPPIERAGALTLPPVIVADDELRGMRAFIAMAQAGGLAMIVVSEPEVPELPGTATPLSPAMPAPTQMASEPTATTLAASDDVDRLRRVPNESEPVTARPPQRMALVTVRPIVIEPLTITPLVPPVPDEESEGAAE